MNEPTNPDDEGNDDDDDFVDASEEFAKVFGERIVFTASGLASSFLFAALVFLVLAIGLAILGTDGWAVGEKPVLPTLWLGLIPLPLAAASAWIGARLLRQPYVELDLDGVLVHPVKWSGVGEGGPERARWNIIKSVEVEGSTVSLGRPPLDPFTFGLTPVSKARRPLLLRALQGRVDSDPPEAEEPEAPDQ